MCFDTKGSPSKSFSLLSETDTLLSDLSCSIVYALVCVAGAHLNLEQLGAEGVSPSHLAVTCLACPLPAQLFWAEEGGHNVPQI